MFMSNVHFSLAMINLSEPILHFFAVILNISRSNLNLFFGIGGLFVPFVNNDNYSPFEGGAGGCLRFDDLKKQTHGMIYSLQLRINLLKEEFFRVIK
jgi:hypothetical protein